MRSILTLHSDGPELFVGADQCKGVTHNSIALQALKHDGQLPRHLVHLVCHRFCHALLTRASDTASITKSWRATVITTAPASFEETTAAVGEAFSSGQTLRAARPIIIIDASVSTWCAMQMDSGSQYSSQSSLQGGGPAAPAPAASGAPPPPGPGGNRSAGMDEIIRESEKTGQSLNTLEAEIWKVRYMRRASIRPVGLAVRSLTRVRCIAQAEEDYFDVTAHGNIVRGWDGFLDR